MSTHECATAHERLRTKSAGAGEVGWEFIDVEEIRVRERAVEIPF